MSLETGRDEHGEERAPAVDPEARADDATVHAFLNCYLRETGDYEVVDEPVAGVDPLPGECHTQ